MTKRDAETVLALLHSLDGSQMADTGLLTLDTLQDLHASAAAAFRGGALPLDEQTLLDTLGEVAQRHCDGGVA